MRHIRSLIIKSTASLLAALLMSATPLASLAVLADGCTPPDPSSQAGNTAPAGADASSFTYQCSGPDANEWTNNYFVYNPADGSRTPIYNPNYGYNCTTDTWTMDEWDYSVPTSTYIESRVPTAAPAGYATNCPVAPSSATGGTGAAAGTANIAGPGSTSNNNLTSTNTTGITNNTNASLNNTILGTALSGNAGVSDNTLGGDATSGSVADEANVVNLLQSPSNALGSGNNVATFTANINGDVNGDLLFDPATIGSFQNATNNTNDTNNLTVNNSNNDAINNNINLTANSGDANVTDNTAGGNATSGSATAIANVMNYIDSSVTSGKSFVGTININGDLNGDILLPQNLVDQLLASNVPTVNVSIPAPNSSTTDNTNISNNATVNNTNNQGINNLVNSNANSGTANDSDNTEGGNATSGNATTNVTAFNLTGSNIVGSNDILVFVNVVGGKWVGMIMNAPAGTTAAELGGGITNNNTNVSNNATLNNSSNENINNNVNVNAKSGNADVSDNTMGGNAKTGDAKTAVNLLNVEGATLDLSNWFGILFINVFGTWNGSFGVNTSAGNPVVASSTAAAASTGLPTQAFRFAPRSSNTYTTGAGSNGNSITTASVVTPAQAAILAASIDKTNAPTPKLAATKSSFWRPATVIGGLVVLYILADAVISSRKRHRNTSK